MKDLISRVVAAGAVVVAATGLATATGTIAASAAPVVTQQVDTTAAQQCPFKAIRTTGVYQGPGTSYKKIATWTAGTIRYANYPYTERNGYLALSSSSWAKKADISRYNGLCRE